ncbi:hypothetical protein [Streptococcus equi]|nr:hypothetical protein [Streptococcus equi]
MSEITHVLIRLDELGRVISDISGHKGMLPFNRKISFKAHQVRYDLPLTV